MHPWFLEKMDDAYEQTMCELKLALGLILMRTVD